MAGEKTDEIRNSLHSALSNFSLQQAHGSGQEVADAIDKLTDAIMQLIKPEDPIDDFGDLQPWE